MHRSLAAKKATGIHMRRKTPRPDRSCAGANSKTADSPVPWYKTLFGCWFGLRMHNIENMNEPSSSLLPEAQGFETELPPMLVLDDSPMRTPRSTSVPEKKTTTAAPKSLESDIDITRTSRTRSAASKCELGLLEV